MQERDLYIIHKIEDLIFNESCQPKMDMIFWCPILSLSIDLMVDDIHWPGTKLYCTPWIHIEVKSPCILFFTTLWRIDLWRGKNYLKFSAKEDYDLHFVVRMLLMDDSFVLITSLLFPWSYNLELFIFDYHGTRSKRNLFVSDLFICSATS